MRGPNMKLVMLAYLEDDQKCVDQLLSEVGVAAFSKLIVEGHGPAAHGGWYGATAPFRSQMILMFADADVARRVMYEVEACSTVEDPNHPIRAFLLDVEDQAACGCRPSDGARNESESSNTREASS